MALIVQKYGGTSVGGTDRIKNVARRVARYHREGHQLVIVVSAMSGETNGGTLFSLVCSTSVTSKPSALMEASVRRLQSQQATNRFRPFKRSCQRARPGSSERTCSMKISRPPGRRTRRSSRRACV